MHSSLCEPYTPAKRFSCGCRPSYDGRTIFRYSNARNKLQTVFHACENAAVLVVVCAFVCVYLFATDKLMCVIGAF